MIAHGFVVVGLFSSHFLEDMKHELSLKWAVYVQSPRFASMFLLLVLASVALPTTFNFVGGLRSYTAFRKLMFGLPFLNDYHLGRY
jgi:NADH:ubiquinone oxidoreductase subunit 4 (subunit M)